MITCNNDWQPEFLYAKRLIREYVKIAFVVSTSSDGSNLSFSNMSCGQTGEEYADPKVKVKINK